MAGSNDDVGKLRQYIEQLERERKESQHREKDSQLREEALQREQEASQRREQILLEEKRKTNFNEFLEYYHEYSAKIQVETDRKKSTQGEKTDRKGRPCPTILREWTSYPAERKAAMDRVLQILQPDNNEIRCFESRSFIEQLIERETNKKLASEEDLKIQLHNLLDTPTAAVASKLAQMWKLGKAVTFRNHDNFAEEMVEADSEKIGRKQKSVPIDQVCLLDTGGERMRRLFVAEHKPPHKMNRDMMYAGLNKEINLPEEIINTFTVPTDLAPKKIHRSKQMVCAAITQAYEYMLGSPTTHACVMTGETIVFLRIDEEDTNILHYYLIEPLEAVRRAVANEEPFPFHDTALAHLVAFTVLAFDAPARDKNWQTKARSKAASWTVDPDEMLRQIHEEQTEATPSPSIAKIRVQMLEERSTPVKTRLFTKKKLQSLDDGPSGLTRRRTPSDSDSDEPGTPDTPTQRGQVTKRGRPSKQGTNSRQSNQQPQNQQKRQYCTHACLFGLTHGLALDTQCPNVVAHRRTRTSLNHVLTQSQLVEAIREQLGHDLVTGVEELNLKGRHGSLFRLELLSHGYVVVAKACISKFAGEFRKEGQVYERLESLQGDMIPVYLGNFDMINPWIEMYYDFTHMLLMSYAGRDIQRHEGIDIEQYAGPYVARCAELGVFHNDLHDGNVVWNEERKSVMFIDLGEVILFAPPAKGSRVAAEAAKPLPRRILQELEVNKSRIPDLDSKARGQKRKWVDTEEMREESLAKHQEKRAQEMRAEYLARRQKNKAQEMRAPVHEAVQRLKTA